jgi:dethiobiotin synthetase
MEKVKHLFIAANSQHVGKTTSTLGLVAAFMKRAIKVGYCKPVGQQILDFNEFSVDKDTVLFADLINFDLRPEVHSPVILGKGATTAYLDDPSKFDFATKIQYAAQILERKTEIIIYEGTGHPGVGSVVNLSNADVAKQVNAGVIFIVEGGIGSAIDELNMCLSLFREKGVPIVGVIVNKVLPEKIEKVRHYLNIWLNSQNMKLLGVIPYDKSLGFPQMRMVAEAINGEVVAFKEKLDNKVEDFLAGSLIDPNKIKDGSNMLLVVSAQKAGEALKKISSLQKQFNLTGSPLAGIVATGTGIVSGASLEYIKKYEIPFVRTDLDTYGSVVKINRIEVKINRNTPWKVSRAIELINENVDMDYILSCCDLRS